MKTDFCLFTSMLMQSQDIDPVYPVLRDIVVGLPVERGLWLTFLYLMHYNIASAYSAFLDHPDPEPDIFPMNYGARGLPIATERRGLRNLAERGRHLHSYVDAIGQSQRAWVTEGFGDDPQANFLLFWDRACTVHQNGRWAAFKWAELLKEVHGLPLAAPDMRLRDCTGPVEGLQMLFNLSTEDPDALQRYAVEARDLLLEDGQDLGWERVETALCKWKMLLKGNYYVGRDIDEMQEVIEHGRAFLPDHAVARLYWARQGTIPNAFLGELKGWKGIRRDWLGVYRDQRIMPSHLL